MLAIFGPQLALLAHSLIDGMSAAGESGIGCSQQFGFCRVGPGNLPEPLTDPDLTLSRHPARAIARRLPPSVEELELLLLPVGSLPTAMTPPLRSTSITPASALLQGSPPLSGASVLSASRLEPLAPCIGLSESRRDPSSPPLSFFRPIPLFDRGDHPLRPDRTSLTPARAEAVKVGRRTNLTACPPLQATP